MDEIVPPVELSCVEVLSVAGEKLGVPDTVRRCKVIHVMKANHIDAELSQAGGDFLCNIVGREVGAERKVHTPKASSPVGFAEVQVTVPADDDTTAGVDHGGGVLAREIHQQVGGVDHGGGGVESGHLKFIPAVPLRL